MRAAGLKDDTSVEIIDIIDDGTDPFTDRAPNATMFDTGGPRWIGPAAAAALVALIGYGVATSASTSGAPKVAIAPSTTVAAPTTTVPPTATTVAAPIVPYYSADPPREYSVVYADVEQHDDNYYGFGDYQLWATPNATATDGSWFSIAT
ncbi:MAG TPA: hypothetical protein VGC84_07150, partial [Ilumatobacteraceae bacterium]